MASLYVTGSDLIGGGYGIDLEGEGGRRRLSRERIADAIEVLVALLDVADQQPDLELNGDEADGQPSEDEFVDHGPGDGPGCIISDPDAAVDDLPCDANCEDGL